MTFIYANLEQILTSVNGNPVSLRLNEWNQGMLLMDKKPNGIRLFFLSQTGTKV